MNGERITSAKLCQRVPTKSPRELEREMASELARALTPVLSFIAKGRRGGTMDLRTWVVLYCTSPDMVEGETIAGFAARRGVDPSRVQRLINELRSMIPGLRSMHQKSPQHVERMRAAHRGRNRRARSGLEPPT